jgi:1-acyl-sn-glycerol-3-phosphate acyltransferase
VILRRLVTFPAIVFALGFVSTTFPALFFLALLIDLAGRKGRFNTTRLLGFLFTFLIVENLGLLMLTWVWLTTPARSSLRQTRTFAVQRLYTAWHLRSVTWMFSLTFVVRGAELVKPGPVLVFVRHASLVDVLIPGGFVANAHQLALRYVLKRELLVEPCLDLAGHWIPNHFVDRRGKDTEAELTALRALKAGIGAGEGVVIYPEGTRFSLRKREAIINSLSGPAKATAERLRHLHPIRPGGAMTLLAAEPKCDVLFVGHHGLEGLTRLEDIWRGALVGKTVTIQFWREKAEAIPQDAQASLEWVNTQWQRVDDWLETFE